LGSKTVTNESVKEEITERLKNAEKLPISERCNIAMGNA
jgi:hypothetical protein